MIRLHHILSLAFALIPTMLLAQMGDTGAYADAYGKCMKNKPQYATSCYDFSCAFQGCIAGYSSVTTRGGVAIADASLREAAIPACLPHIQAMKQCIAEKGLINQPVTPPATPLATPPQSGGLSLSCKAGDNDEGSCCCFLGAHTYQFAPRQVASATITFDTGRILDCRSTVSIQARVNGVWQHLRDIAANSSSGGSEVAPITVEVPVNRVIDGISLGDGCVCCIDDSKVVLH